MRGRYKHNVKVTATVASFITPGTAPVLANTVQANTATGYLSQIHQLEDFEYELALTDGPWRGRSMDGDMFQAFITAIAALDGGQHSSAMQFLNAAKFHQRVHNWRVPQNGFRFSEQDIISRTCRGAMYNSGVDLAEIIRGALDQPLYEQLKSYLPRCHTADSLRPFGNATMYSDAITIGFNCALRIHELENIKVEHWNRDKRILTIPGCKADKMFNAVGKSYEKLIILPEGIDTLNRLTRHRRGSEYIFPSQSKGGYAVKKCGEFIKEFALVVWKKKFPELKFDGVHVLRHGGSQAIDAWCKKYELPEATRKAALCMSAANEQIYLRTNADRITKIRANNDARERDLAVPVKDPMQKEFRGLIALAQNFESSTLDGSDPEQVHQRAARRAYEVRTGATEKRARRAGNEVKTAKPFVPPKVKLAVRMDADLSSRNSQGAQKAKPIEKKKKFSIFEIAKILQQKNK